MHEKEMNGWLHCLQNENLVTLWECTQWWGLARAWNKVAVILLPGQTPHQFELRKLQRLARSSIDAELVVHYNKTKRSKSVVERHQETAARSKSMKQSKHESVNEESKGNHPWKPWDRERDLTAGRGNVEFDASDMSQKSHFQLFFVTTSLKSQCRQVISRWINLFCHITSLEELWSCSMCLNMYWARCDGVIVLTCLRVSFPGFLHDDKF